MITIVHGEDVSSSRKFFIDEKQKTNNPVYLEGKNTNIADLTMALEGDSLFFEHKNIFLENFLTGKKSNTKEFKEIVEFINSRHKDFNIYFFDDKELTKSIISAFEKPIIKEFKLPQVLFSFLDSLKPNSKQNLINFHSVLKNTECEMIFFMLVRQFRLLLALSDSSSSENIDEIKRLAPWQQTKLKSQAKLFGEEKLKKIYKILFKTDLGLKSGNLPLTLEQTIDIFLLEI